MRRFLFALAASAALTAGHASAADLPVKAPAAYVTPAPVSIWAGGYVGANIGYGWGRAEATVGGVTGSQDLDGVIGGGQIGYNWQWASPLVLGIEADFQGSGQKHDAVIGAATITNSISWFATLRGRIGYAPSNWMIYATGGLAYGEFRSEATLNGVNASISAWNGCSRRNGAPSSNISTSTPARLIQPWPACRSRGGSTTTSCALA
jgi:outer membrane immunogenic protein